jgi:nicotinate-nucleotide pyrophosphorylase (carboxylating)
VALDASPVRRLVREALREDLGEAGDLTTDALFDRPRAATARIVARESLTLAGLPYAREVFAALDPQLQFEARRNDGARVDAGTVVAVVKGDIRGLLRGERTALNFLMRASGIATATASAVAEIEGSGCRVLDTRKTAPGLRLLDKYAVHCGGGTNHRMGLHDAVMVKDTHLDAGISIREAVTRVLATGLPAEKITVEVRDPTLLEEAIAAGAGRALLDNMSTDELRRAVEIGAGRIELEASGGLEPGKLAAVAATGVDALSLGWLTHSAPAADLAMEIEAER